MQILERIETTSRIDCIISLEGEKYNEANILNLCTDKPKYSSCISNIVGEKGKYEVSIQIGEEPVNEFFLDMINQYGAE